MTRLTYRGNKYYKESFLQQDLQIGTIGIVLHFVRYRGRKYRPVQVGGQYSKELNKLQTSDSL